MSLTADGVQKVVEIARPERFVQEVGGKEYTFALPDYRLLTPPKHETLELSTLQGLADFINGHNTEFGRLFVVVDSPGKVRVISKINHEFKSRDQFATAVVSQNDFKFGHWYQQEEFLIAMRSMFVQDANSALVLKFAGSIIDSAEVGSLDDGISQATTIKAGIANKEQVIIPSPLVLEPFRTFREIDQPGSEFVFRMRKGGSFSLHEADGGVWRLEAVSRIKEWLRGKIPTECEIYA